MPDTVLIDPKKFGHGVGHASSHGGENCGIIHLHVMNYNHPDFVKTLRNISNYVHDYDPYKSEGLFEGKNISLRNRAQNHLYEGVYLFEFTLRKERVSNELIQKLKANGFEVVKEFKNKNSNNEILVFMGN